LKSGFCDPLQITQRGAGNGGIWVDFNDAKPRDMRMGTFPAVPAGGKPIPESDPSAPIIWFKRVGFKASDWHHVAMVWTGFDTGRKDARTALYVDGKLIGELKDREISMDWDLEKTGIYISVGYIGLFDELAVFNKALTPAEIMLLFKSPGLLTNRSAR
jgi:hypothetical protein